MYEYMSQTFFYKIRNMVNRQKNGLAKSKIEKEKIYNLVYHENIIPLISKIWTFNYFQMIHCQTCYDL